MRAVAQPSSIEVVLAGDVSIVNVQGLVDEHFAGFKNLGDGVKSVVLNVTGMTRMTSFGVRQWLKGIDGIPKSVTSVYLLGCPTFFVDQLNMVLNFGGSAQVLTVMAPYTCTSCGAESGEVIDVLAERASLAKGGVSEKECSRCGGKLEFDETPESYFSFVQKYAATSIDPSVAEALGSRGLYTAVETSGEKPPKIIKLVHGAVTYFRIRGTIGSMFRARPFLVGAEGEVVLDLSEVETFDPSGQREWTRLLKTLSAQVPAVTLVDISASFLQNAGASLSMARTIGVWSVLVPYRCADCGRTSSESHELEGTSWPLVLPEIVCSTCGGKMRSTLAVELLSGIQKASTTAPTASAKLIRQRAEVLSRALTDANVAQAGQGAHPARLAADDTILGKYKIVQRLSAGGMAEVFLAKQVGIGGFEKPVALKRIQRQLLENRHLAIDMFLNEAKIAGRLTHPNIVQVLDVGEDGGALYLAMEYVHGKDLREIVKVMRASGERIPSGLACHIVREVAQALHHAYWSTDMAGKRLSVVHRDVSPHNVILGYDGTVKLLDFGVAMSDVTEEAETMIVGKWQYMSPEHTNKQPLDHRSDLFSLGVVLYLLLTGAMPFGGGDPKDIVKRIRRGQYKPLQEYAIELPAELVALVDRMLAASPDKRPQTGQEVVTALTDIMVAAKVDASAAQLAEYLSTMFAQPGANVVELSTTGRQSGSIQLPSRVALGSGPTHRGVVSSSFPSVGSSLHTTPTDFSGEIDVSVSLVVNSDAVPSFSPVSPSGPMPSGPPVASIPPPVTSSASVTPAALVKASPPVTAKPEPPTKRAAAMPAATAGRPDQRLVAIVIVVVVAVAAILYFAIQPK